MVRAQVQEHVVRVCSAAAHAPFFRNETQCLLLQILLCSIQCVRVEFGGACRMVLAQRMPLPGPRHHDALQVRVAVEDDAVEIPHLAFVPVCIGPDAGRGGQAQIICRESDLDAHVAVTFRGQQMIEDAEVCSRQAFAVRPQSFVDPMEVVEHRVGLRQLTQEAQHPRQVFAAHPHRRQVVDGRLVRDSGSTEALTQLDDNGMFAAGLCAVGMGAGLVCHADACRIGFGSTHLMIRPRPECAAWWSPFGLPAAARAATAPRRGELPGRRPSTTADGAHSR